MPTFVKAAWPVEVQHYRRDCVALRGARPIPARPTQEQALPKCRRCWPLADLRQAAS